MPISPWLQASARSAYRSLFRAAYQTFSGDDHVLQAFLNKTRSAYRDGRSLTDEEKYENNVTLAREVALVLRQNVIQGRRSSVDNLWKLHITADTELGDNETIKGGSNKTSREKQSHRSSATRTADSSLKQSDYRVNFSQLKRKHKERSIPRLDEEDIEESFVRGSGPGGQSVNKTENCVQILHKPSRIRVSCQETRSLDLNRRFARKLLLEKLDELHNPGLSRGDMRRARMNERDRQKRKKRKKKKQTTVQEEGSL